MALGILALAVVGGLAGGGLTRNYSSASDPIAYADFISVMLTSISLLMALLAVFLAVLGVIGWNAIVTEARVRAERFLDESFQPGSDFSRRLEARAEDVVRGYLSSNFEEGRDLSEMVRRHVREEVARTLGFADEQFERDVRDEKEEDER
jgi:hypothetical protein